jgi:hypothetical protein
MFPVSIFALCLLLTLNLSSVALAGDKPLDRLTDKTVSYFRPLSADLLRVEGDRVWLNIGTRDGVIKGMRLTVFTRGEQFYHPVTREPLGRIEKKEGVVEVTEVRDDLSTCRVIEGRAGSGSIARISALKKRLLFYQEGSVDYYLGDAYYRGLKNTGRFEIIDAPLEEMTEEQLFELVSKKKAELVLRLSAERDDGRLYLKQTLLWSDGKTLSDDSAEISTSFINELRYGAKFLSELESEPLLTYDLPYTGVQICTGDLNGDGRAELIISSSTEIHVYGYDTDLTPIHKIAIDKAGTILRMDTFDLDRDGKDEVFLTVISDDLYDVTSYIYRFMNGRLVRFWEKEGFLRVMDDEILHQGYSRWEGYSGRITRIEYDGTAFKEREYKVVKGLNIFDFVKFSDTGGRNLYLTINDDNYIEVLDESGISLWQSKDDLGGFTRSYRKVQEGHWFVKDRMLNKGGEVVVIKRNPIVDVAKGFGFRNSQLILYWYGASGIKRSVLIEGIDGELLDFAIFDNRLAVINKPMIGVKPSNIIRGEQIFVTELNIYSLKGK